MISNAEWAQIICCINKIVAEGGGGVPSPEACGDLLVGTAGGEWIIFPRGTNGQALLSNDGEEGCLEWATLPGGGDMLAANNLSDLTDKPLALINLGGTTVGINIFKASNPSAITFLRVNADNSVSLLDAAAFRTAIGAGTGNGTVTSVALTMPSGFSVANSPVTTSGTLAVTTTLNGNLRGNGSGFVVGDVTLGTETTGDYVEDLTGTANEITVTGGTGEGSNPVVALAATVDLTTHVLILPIGSTPAAAGELFFNADVWTTGSSALQIGFGGGVSDYQNVISVDVSDTPGNGESPVFNTGTGRWEYGSPSASPAGSDTQIQYNNAGAFGAEAGFTYDQSVNTFTVPNTLTTGWTVEGHTAQLTTFAGVTTPKHQLHGTSTTLSSGSQSKWAADATGPYFILTSSRGASPGTYTVVVNGDSLGKISFQGADGTDFAIGAEIEARVSAAPGNNDMPSSLFFRTTPDASATPADRWVIDHTGLLYPAADATHDIGSASFRPRDIYLSRNVIFPDGVRQTFNPDNTNAGINVGANGSAPASPTNGDMYYDSGTNEFFARINGAWVSLGSGGGAPTNATYIVQTPDGTLSNEQAISALASGILRGATTTGVITSLGDVLPVVNGGTGFAGALLAIQTKCLTSTTTSASTSFADVGAEMSFAVGNGETWICHFEGPITASSATEGGIFALNGPTTSLLEYYCEVRTNTTTWTANGQITTYDTGTAGANTSLGSIARLMGILTTTAAGTVALRIKAETGGGANFSALRGWVMRAMRIS